MPKRSNAFQRLITLLNATLGGKARVVESAMLRDKVTGEEREVDVLITGRAANYNVSIGIEVVSWGRPAGTPWVERMRAKRDNLELDKLVLVSDSGFTKPAVQKASFYNIETLTVESALVTDWPLLATLESTGVFEITTLKYDCSLVFARDDGTMEQLDVPLDLPLTDGVCHVTTDVFIRRLPDLPALQDALNLRLQGSREQDFWLSYVVSDGAWRVAHDGATPQVEEVRIGMKVLRIATPVQFAKGKFQDTPFLSGISVPGSKPLQFVLAKRPDGVVSGYLVDDAGVRTLASRSECPGNEI